MTVEEAALQLTAIPRADSAEFQKLRECVSVLKGESEQHTTVFTSDLSHLLFPPSEMLPPAHPDTKKEEKTHRRRNTETHKESHVKTEQRLDLCCHVPKNARTTRS